MCNQHAYGRIAWTVLDVVPTTTLIVFSFNIMLHYSNSHETTWMIDQLCFDKPFVSTSLNEY